MPLNSPWYSLEEIKLCKLSISFILYIRWNILQKLTCSHNSNVLSLSSNGSMSMNTIAWQEILCFHIISEELIFVTMPLCLYVLYKNRLDKKRNELQDSTEVFWSVSMVNIVCAISFVNINVWICSKCIWMLVIYFF